jgi:NAD(P)-dependent dehydrogenase (short-subunit alcohol dehydrogenase family)
MNTLASTATGNEFLGEVFSLDGRVAVVVGGTSGLGAAASVALARCGAKVTVAGRSGERGAAVVEEIQGFGGEAAAEEVDVRNELSVAALAERCFESHGRVDVLVNSAGVFAMTPTVELSMEEWKRIVETNLDGTFLCCREFGRRMIEAGGGSIINLASTDSFVGVPEEAAYCASKGGVAQLTRVLGAEWIKHGVRVNAIGPTDFATPMTAPVLDDPEYLEWTTTAIPAGRVGQPHELVGALLFLASDASVMVVGHTLMVDGGRTII